jgi:type II secretory pathway predicted ATPase ExeA
MVLDYYNLKEQPFGVTPDPRYLYYSPIHREALATLSYGIRSGRGFMSLIAEPGMGKTTILFQLLRELEASTRTVFLFQTLCTPKELLQALLRDLGVDDGDNVIRMQQKLNDVLLLEARRGRRVVVVIDEAQNLDDSALESVRMLSNFETSSDKLLQIVLAGQPRLREKLASPHLLQLRQRMSIFARLHPFSAEETRRYVSHRLEVAGYHFKTPLFTQQAGSLIAKHSEGIPRNINNICFNALSLGYVLKQKTIEEDVIRESLVDLDLDVDGARGRPEEVAGQTISAVSASNLGTVHQRSFSSRARFAACFLVFLQVLLFTGGRQVPEAQGSPSSLLGNSVSQAAVTPIGQTKDPSQMVPAVNGELGLGSESSWWIASNETFRISEASLPIKAQQPERNFRDDKERAIDPAQLWAEVRAENSDAEVDLARLYLEGTAVTQNCAQAEVLLRAAARRGNSRVAHLLNNYRDSASNVGRKDDARCGSLLDPLSISAMVDSQPKGGNE